MAAGQGFKTFVTGEVLTAGDVNGYLMQGINVFTNATARDAAITAPAEGQFAFTKDNNSLWYYDGAAWVASGATGDIEGVTAGVGISGGGTSGTVTVTNSMATAIDAKGDLVPGTGADTFARLAVGANNTVLTADSTTATGLKWASPTSNPSFSLLSTTTLPAATSVTVSGLSGYNTLYLIVKGASSGSTSVGFRYRVNSNTSNIYNAYGFNIVPPTTYGVGIGQAVIAEGDAMPLGQMSTHANSAVSGFARLEGCNSSGIKMAYQASGASPIAVNGAVYTVTGGFIDTTDVVSSITFLCDSGSFDAGTLRIYGSVA